MTDAPAPRFGEAFARRLRLAILWSPVILGLLVWAILRFHPRTDDATIVANVVGVAPRVSGVIEQVAVADNQFVHKGDLLFAVDPAPYHYALERAEAQAESAADTLRRLEPLVPKAYATSQQLDEAQSQLRAAEAARDSARYDLESCRVVAPCDAYVSNLNLSPGAFAHAGAETVTLIDVGNWYVIANFRESLLSRIRPGDRAEVRIMTRSGARFRGTVQGVGRGVVAEELPRMSGLPGVPRELNWVRLAQRFPVRIRLDVPPEQPGVALGASAVVIVDGHGSR